MPLPLFFSRRASAGSLGPTSAGTFCRGVTAFQVNKLYIQRAGGGLEFCDALLTNDAFPGNWTTGVFSAAGQARGVELDAHGVDLGLRPGRQRSRWAGGVAYFLLTRVEQDSQSVRRPDHEAPDSGLCLVHAHLCVLRSACCARSAARASLEPLARATFRAWRTARLGGIGGCPVEEPRESKGRGLSKALQPLHLADRLSLLLARWHGCRPLLRTEQRSDASHAVHSLVRIEVRDSERGGRMDWRGREWEKGPVRKGGGKWSVGDLDDVGEREGGRCRAGGAVVRGDAACGETRRGRLSKGDNRRKGGARGGEEDRVRDTTGGREGQTAGEGRQGRKSEKREMRVGRGRDNSN
eukprot:3678227-Rhodomonas_salina.1